MVCDNCDPEHIRIGNKYPDDIIPNPAIYPKYYIERTISICKFCNQMFDTPIYSEKE